MKEYLLVFRNGPVREVPRTQQEIAENMELWKNWIGAIAQEGKFVGGHPLVNTGKVVSNDGKHITDSPFAEGKEVLNGYVLVKANDYNDALKHAKTCPIFEDKGTVEVREVAQMDM